MKPKKVRIRRKKAAFSESYDIQPEQIQEALDTTKSISQAVRALGISKPTFYKYYDMYFDREDLKKYSNPQGRGIAKGGMFGKVRNFEKVLSGHYNGHKLNKIELRDELIRELILIEQCDECGFNEKRIYDETGPFVLDFHDGNDENFKLENLRLICYNCAYLTGVHLDRKGSYYYEPVTGQFYRDGW